MEALKKSLKAKGGGAAPAKKRKAH
jgi:hypothetical protein